MRAIAVLSVVGLIAMILANPAAAGPSLSWDAGLPDCAVDLLVFDYWQNDVVAVAAVDAAVHSLYPDRAGAVELGRIDRPAVSSVEVLMHLVEPGTSEATPQSSGAGCLMTTVNWGLQSGGSVDDFLLLPSIPSLDHSGNLVPRTDPPSGFGDSGFGAQYSGVPEPGTFALMGIGLETLLFKNRRRLLDGLHNRR